MNHWAKPLENLTKTDRWEQRYPKGVEMNNEPKKNENPSIVGLEAFEIEDVSVVEQKEREVQEGFVERIREDIPKMGRVLADPNRARKQGDKVRAHERELVKAILSRLPEGYLRELVIVELMGAIIEHYPATGDSLNRMTDIGDSLGYFREEAEEDPDGVVLNLLPSKDDGTGGFRKEYRVINPIPGTRGHTAKIREKIEENERSFKENEEEQVNRLKEGAVLFLEALATGRGEGYGVAPAKLLPNRWMLGGGTLRVLVADGCLHPVGAVGKCTKRFAEVRDILDGKGLGLPVKSIEEERLRLNQRFEPEVFRALSTFHDLCRRMLVHERNRDERIKKAKADMASFKSEETIEEDTTEARLAFLKGDQAGIIFLYLKYWNQDIVDDNGKPVDEMTHHGIRFLFERNAGRQVRVARCREVHQKLFKGCREFAPLEDHSWPLPKMIRIIKGRLESAV